MNAGEPLQEFSGPKRFTERRARDPETCNDFIQNRKQYIYIKTSEKDGKAMLMNQVLEKAKAKLCKNRHTVLKRSLNYKHGIKG